MMPNSTPLGTTSANSPSRNRAAARRLALPAMPGCRRSAARKASGSLRRSRPGRRSVRACSPGTCRRSRTFGSASASVAYTMPNGASPRATSSKRGAHVLRARDMGLDAGPYAERSQRVAAVLARPGRCRDWPSPAVPRQARRQGRSPALCAAMRVESAGAISTSRLRSRSMRVPGRRSLRLSR